MREQDYRQQEGAAEFLDAAQNARLVEDAEKYYRVMYHGGAESWSVNS